MRRKRRRGAGERLWLEGGVVDPNLCSHRHADGLGESVLWCSKCGAVNFRGHGWELPIWALRLRVTKVTEAGELATTKEAE